MKRQNQCNNKLNGASSLDSFGMLMRERTYSSATYRFGFNGKEKDNEIHDDETFELRVAFDFDGVIANDEAEKIYKNLSEKELKAYHQQERSLYYVVFSRAIQQIYITGVGEKSGWIERK